MPHDDQLSLALALSINPKPCNFSSTKLLLHPNFNLNLVHIKKTPNAFSSHIPLSLSLGLPRSKHFFTLNLKWALILWTPHSLAINLYFKRCDFYIIKSKFLSIEMRAKMKIQILFMCMSHEGIGLNYQIHMWRFQLAISFGILGLFN